MGGSQTDTEDTGPWAAANAAIEWLEEIQQEPDTIETRVIEGTYDGRKGATIIRVKKGPQGGRHTEVISVPQDGDSPKPGEALKGHLKGKKKR